MTQKAYIVASSMTEARKVGGMFMSLGYTYQGFHSAADCISALGDKRLSKPDVLFVEEEISGLGGIELLKLCEMGDLNIPSVISVVNERFEQALQVVHMHQVGFVIKPLNAERIEHSLQDVLEKVELTSKVRSLKSQLNENVDLPEMIGESAAMKSVTALMKRCAHSSMTVLIQGESGVGKEVVAKSLKALSERFDKPYVAINCGAIPENLVESAFFGHVKGAFTGAAEDSEGCFVAASGGTLFLDEVGELPLVMQVKLLRALQEGEVTPVGSSTAQQVDVRVIAATNKDLAALVAEGHFREDLYYRLNVLPIDVPPLRARGEDVILLANHFLHKYAYQHQTDVLKLNESAKQVLMSLPWPGNVRQLENAVYRAAVLADGSALNKNDFYFMGLENTAMLTPKSSSQWPTLEEMERQYVLKVVATCEGNLSEASRILGISRSTLYRKLPEGAQEIQKESIS